MNSRKPVKRCLSYTQLAAHVHHPEADQVSISAHHANDIGHKSPCRSRERTNESRRTTYRLPFGFGLATILLFPAPCWAAADGLPWDQTLTALQDILIGPVVHAVIALAFIGAGFLYAVGGYDRQAGRLAASGIGGCLALGATRLLNFVFP